jgi:head-tail adaptor
MTAPLASRLRARLVLESPAPSTDDLGGGPAQFLPAGHVFAEIVALDDGETRTFAAVAPVSLYRCTLRRPAAVRSGWRVRWGDRVFRVRSMRDGRPPEGMVELTIEEEFR